MNLIVLSLTDLFCKSAVRLRLLRMCAAALLGAVCTAFLFLVLPSRVLFDAAGTLLLVPLMVLTSFGFGGSRVFVRRILAGWLSAVLLGGVVTAFCGQTGIRVLPVYAAVFVFLAARILVKNLVGAMARQRREFPLTLSRCERSIHCMGLYDSGCLLAMPLSGEPVHIIAPQTLQVLLGEEESAPQFIPYRALGTDRGQIAVYRLDQIEIQERKGTKILEHPWVGSAQESLLRGKSYQVILHAGVVENE